MNIQVIIHILDKKVEEEAKGFDGTLKGRSAKMLVFDFTIDDITGITWVTQQMGMTDFYFARAKAKFQEYLDYQGNREMFTSLLKSFKDSDKVFSQFLYTHAESSSEFQYLTLCGQLVAYLDRHAYNKNIWNLYDDKRTLARSSVNQTRWIENLINFKVSSHDYSVLTDSIKNALLYLKQPAENLTMLSVRQRMLVSRVLFNNVPQADFTYRIGEYFSQKDIVCINRDNNGSLYSRILYIPDIKELWNVDADEVARKTAATSITAEEPFDSESSEYTIVEAVEEVRQRNLKMLMHSDIYAKEDLLHYETYASGAKQRLEDAHKVMGLADMMSRELGDIFNNWASVKVTDSEVKKLIQLALCPNKETYNLLKKGAEDELSTVFKNTVDDAFAYAMVSDTQQMDTTKGTLFGAYNAVTGYYQNVRNYKDGEAKLQSIIMGGTAQGKAQKAFELCSSFAKDGNEILLLN